MCRPALIGFQARRGSGVSLLEEESIPDPERDPFYEGLRADIQEGVEAADRGDLFDGEGIFRELLGEEPAVVEN